MTSRDQDSSTAAVTDDLASQAEAEAAAAEARAEAARARAEELRRQLTKVQAESPKTDPELDPELDSELDSDLDLEIAVPDTRRSVLRLVGPLAAALLTAGLLALTGVMLWQHHDNVQRRQQTAEYAAAARQGVINLMSIDYATAQDTVKRVLDGSTGRFKANFADTADDFVKALQKEKVVTKATVNDAAVESMTSDSAVVLVSATSRREGPQAPKDEQQPRLWRLVLTLERDGGQIKMSGVEFV